jgi:ubiquitin-conjugating enzyme E2 H
MLRRRETDLMKLIHGGFNVHVGDNAAEFWVEFVGPAQTPYDGGVWFIHVLLPDAYPFSSPSIGFSNKIFHPNVDERSGSVCLDVINQTWTPLYELRNVFEVFLPQLLHYPNPADPLNPQAAALLQNDPIGYLSLVQDHVARHATREAAERAVCGVGVGPTSPQGQSRKSVSALEDSPATNFSVGLTESPLAPSPMPCSTDDYEPEEIEL